MDHDAFDARLAGSVLQPFISDYCAHLRRGRYAASTGPVYLRCVAHSGIGSGRRRSLSRR
jgi:hypothetical protein